MNKYNKILIPLFLFLIILFLFFKNNERFTIGGNYLKKKGREFMNYRKKQKALRKEAEKNDLKQMNKQRNKKMKSLKGLMSRNNQPNN